jgi:hypothetical protein
LITARIVPLLIFCFSCISGAWAQNPLAEKYLRDSTYLARVQADSLARDSAAQEIGLSADSLDYDTTVINIQMSPDSLDAEVTYGSVDSNYFDNANHRVYLYGDAYVKYKDLEIKADFIIVDLDSSIATAEGLIDSSGQLAGNPEFTMSGQKPFSAKKMRYNFRTRKGYILEILTQQTDLYIHGARTKFIAQGDTVYNEDVLYQESALITTCDAPHPHFGIRASKIKTIPDKLAVIGTSNLELFGVPTPLILPFGFYPVSNTRRAGLIFPRDYEQSPAQGFGLRDLGYYFPIGERMDIKLLTDVYFNGTWGVGTITNYVKKYKYRGNVELRYSSRVSEPADDYRKIKQNSFAVNITHAQDPKANPNQTLGGSIRIQSNDYQSLNYNDAQSALENIYSSNFNYSRTFPGKPYSLTASFNHSQNTRSHLVTINAPDINFRLNRIYPFKRKIATGGERWYEKIAVTYNNNTKSFLQATDTTLFEKETWDDFKYGMQHKATANASFSLLKYFNFTPSINYGETWFFQTREREFEFDPDNPEYVRQDTVYFPDSSGYYILQDTVNFGKLDSRLKQGFTPYRELSVGVSMNTQIFGTLQFKKGWLRGIRHVMKPSVGFSYTPKSPTSYFQPSQWSVQYPDSLRLYSRYENLLFGARPIEHQQSNINFSITNLFEAKYFSKRDTTTKKLKLFDNINVAGSYNMALNEDQNPWSPFVVSGTTRFFKGITTITIGANWSAYALLPNGTLSKRAYLKTDKKLLRFDNMRIRLSTGLSYNDVKMIFGNKDAAANSGDKVESGAAKPYNAGDAFLDLLSNFTISHEVLITRRDRVIGDTTVLTNHTINLVGSMQLSPNWHLRFGNIGYDFLSERLTYPDIGIARDLHCWQLGFTFQPDRQTYSFSINAKPGTFDFLKYNDRRGNYEQFGF